MYYLLYWAIVLSLLAWKWYSGTLTDRRQVRPPTPPVLSPVRLHSIVPCVCAPLPTVVPCNCPACWLCPHSLTSPGPLLLRQPLQAQLDDFKSFAAHRGDRMDAEAGLGACGGVPS